MKPRKPRKKPAEEEKIPEVAETPQVDLGNNQSESLFDDLDVPAPLEIRPDDLPALDSDLTADQKKEFLALIHKEMSQFHVPRKFRF